MLCAHRIPQHMKNSLFIDSYIKHKHKLIFLVIIIIGACLRFYQVFNSMPWADDAGRDLLVAKHLVDHSAPLWSSPTASGTTFLNNTPMYFWLVGLFYFFGRSVSFVMISFASMGVVTVVLAYTLGKTLRGTFMGLTLASLVSLSYITIIPSRSILQPNLTGMLIMATLIFYTQFHRSKSFYDGLLLVVSMFAGIALHLGYLPVFTFFSIALVWELSRAQRLHKSLIIFIVYYVALFFWALMYIKIPSLRAFFNLPVPIDRAEYLQNMGFGLLNFSNYLFFGAPMIIKIILGEVALVMLFVKPIPGYVKKMSPFVFFSAIFWINALLCVCLVYGNSAPYYYYDAFYVITLVGFAVLIERIIPIKIKILLATLFIVGTAYSTKAMITYEPRKEYVSALIASTRIIEDYKKYDDHAGQEYNFWVVAAQGDYPGIFGMFSEQYWYVLETLVKKELTIIVNGSQNSRPIVLSPRFIYLICKVGEFYFVSADQCVTQMATHYPYDFTRFINPTTIDNIVVPYFTLHIIRFENTVRAK